MKIAVVVYGSPHDSPASLTAYRYVRAALEMGHRVGRVFFYGEGIHNGSRLASPPQDEADLPRLWQELGQSEGLDMVVCVAAALRRGVLNEEEATRHAKRGDNLADGFELSGLGQLIDALGDSDRLMTFGGH